MIPLDSRSYTLNLPRRVVFGRGLAERLPDVFADRSVRSILLLSDETLEKLGVVERVRASLATQNREVAIFTAIPPEPPTTCLADALALAKDQGVIDLVIGLGGGSVMDVAKVVALCLGHQKPPEDFYGINRVPDRGLPTLLMPTTAGTGSEVTPVSILTDVEKQVKARTFSPHILPDYAVIDPALTDSVPPKVTAATGIDALVHAIEAYIAKVSTPYSQGVALEAVRYISQSVLRAYQDGSDREARDQMAVGANLAGMAFANSSCCAVHALALPVGGRFHIPHGEATGGLLPATMRVNAPACAGPFAELAAAMGLSDTRPEAFIAELERLKDALGLPASLAHYGVTTEALPELAERAVEIRTLIEPNPVEVETATAIEIYQACL